MHLQTPLLEILQASLIRPVALALLAWLLLRAFRVRHPASQHAVWSFVLAAMLVLPFAATVAPHWQLALPQMPRIAHPAAAIVAPAPAHHALLPARRNAELEEDAAAAVAASALPAPAPAPLPRRVPARSLPLALLLAAAYLFGVAAIALYRLFGWTLLRRLVARSTATPWPGVRQSTEVVAPVVAGTLRPIVLLPAAWQEWDAATRHAVMAHERAHVERRDSLTLALAGVVKCLYWFHPLAWIVAGRVNETADLACDAAVLEQGGDVETYTRTLLSFAALVSRAGHRATVPGLAMATRHLGRRVARVYELARGLAAESPRQRPRRLVRPGVVLALAGLPALCLAATIAVGSRAAGNAALAPPAAPHPRSATAAAPSTAAPAPAPTALPVAPHFIAASVRDLGNSYSTSTQPPTFIEGVFSVRASLNAMVRYAYGATHVQGPALEGADNHAYDIIALAPSGTSELALRAMMRNLLAKRFGLREHTVGVMLRGYDLVVSGGPRPALARSNSADGTCAAVAPAGLARTARMQCKGVTMSQFAAYFGIERIAPAYTGNMPVEDKTGLSQAFDFDLKWRYKGAVLDPHADGYDADYDVTFFEALDRQLGLRLEPADVTSPVIVADAVSSTPTPDRPDAARQLPIAPAAFASADLKPGAPGAKSVGFALSRDGKIRFTNFPVARLIRYAYDGLEDSQVIGAPDWTQTDTYTVLAQLAPAGNVRTDVRNLLASRFHLAAHFETRPVEAWALRRVSAGTRPLLPPEGIDDAEITVNDDGTTWLNVTSMSMDEVADWGLRQYARKYIADGQIVNLTGLNGAYNFTLSFKTDPAAPNGPGPNKIPLFQALHDQLGLTLTKEMVPQKVLVVDRIDRALSN